MRWTASTLALTAAVMLTLTGSAVAADADLAADPTAAFDPTPDVLDSTPAAVGKAPAADHEAPAANDEMQKVKESLLELKRDLVILEEDLLFPASSQVAVFLSMDLGEFFQLDSVTLELNGQDVASHLYTEREVDALYRGGVQKLYVGNVKQGSNRITAFFTGRGPSGRDYRRATTVEFEKTFEPTFVELAISDSTAKYQPEFRAAVSN